ncbi:DUF294 nucleotidyltransferase-like domain-containing protein [Arsenicicoccus piscis]|uniref:Protein-PII uridylyltransferase N-terminal domain-containing protein n=1 Tax=Arsenicicoccus piscis TaxID=673954 RepID=A0ABQ6HMM3_9MICO|nr:DUF294 nucleotidyltransferase-like domain-containing protein [Arsenicicoccus piscis]GMA19675.1 hypothetical protein GCM10025862_16960 [Arsenicicoccus piscis]
MVSLRDFSLSPATADVALHQQLRHATTLDELALRAREAPGLLDRLLQRGLASGKVIAVYSNLVDTTIRRALELAFVGRPDLPMEAFTWIALGSNGRREAVLSSDVDSAVAFVDGTTDEQMAAYRAVFATVDVTLANAGLTSDKHGVSARSAAMSRTHTQWREAAHHWLLDPAEDKGAIMTSLLVDGRPIYGDPGLAAISTIFRDLREHPLTMRLLLIDALARRATLRSAREAPWRRSAHFDIKGHALLPWSTSPGGPVSPPAPPRCRP